MRRSTLMALAAMAAFTACTDTSAPPLPSAPTAPTRVSPTTTPTQLDIEIGSVTLALFPKGLETAAGTRWGNVKRKLAENDRPTAITMFNELSSWIMGKEGQMDGTPAGETQHHATVRLLAMMAAYVYGGEPVIPIGQTSGDVAVDLVLPGEAKTIVTPSANAGVALQAGSVAVPTLIVISQNTGSLFERCKGPLGTLLCQYPGFYRFEPFPYAPLLKPGKFGVCHVNAGPFAPPEDIHDRFRLAHTLPADPANYIPGGIRPEGENIEILPLVHVDFLNCDDTEYGGITPSESPLRERHWYDRGLLALGHVLDAAGGLLTPKNAYAIDLGGGGESLGFSDFNVIDPLSLTAQLIDFETFLGDVSTSPICDAGCDAGRQFAELGVRFDFHRSGSDSLFGHASIQQSSNNPASDANNHVLQNALVGGEGGGNYVGTLIMRFPTKPMSVSFVVRMNDCLQTVVNAFGDGTEALGEGTTTLSSSLTYGGGIDECTAFRQQTVTVTNAAGISRIELPGDLVMVDDLRIVPVLPPAPPIN
jgi:hypothetical protein